MSFPALRKRVPSEQVTGANLRIAAGLFGAGGPLIDPTYGVGAAGNLYAYHEGDIFTPGAMNWVFEPQFELPLYTIWGKAFCRVPNVFNPIQPQQAYMQPHALVNGMGGLQAGYMEFQPLLSQDDTQLPFSG